MNSIALVIMIFAMSMVWGGLAWSIMHLLKHPDIDMDKVPTDQ